MNPYDQRRPFESGPERLVTDALMSQTVPGYILAAMVRPPLPQVEPFPPKFGYDRSAIGIDDVLGMDRYYPNRRMDYSGTPAGIDSTSRPATGG